MREQTQESGAWYLRCRLLFLYVIWLGAEQVSEAPSSTCKEGTEPTTQIEERGAGEGNSAIEYLVYLILSFNIYQGRSQVEL